MALEPLVDPSLQLPEALAHAGAWTEEELPWLPAVIRRWLPGATS